MNESVISWNLPNFVTLFLMLALVWTGLGMLSHLVRRGRSKVEPAQVKTVG